MLTLPHVHTLLKKGEREREREKEKERKIERDRWREREGLGLLAVHQSTHSTSIEQGGSALPPPPHPPRAKGEPPDYLSLSRGKGKREDEQLVSACFVA